MSTALVKYMNRDYLDFYNNIKDRIPLICPEWTDTSESDFGIVLIQLFCGVADQLSYYLDRAVNESFLETAEERSSVIRLCKMLNYTLHQRYASTGRLLMAMQLLTEDSYIPQYSIFSTIRDVDNNIYYFENTEQMSVYESVFDVIKSFTYSGSTYSANYALEGNTEQDFKVATSLTTGDCIYFGYKHMWNNMSVRITLPTVGLTGVWEFYSGDYWTGISNIVDGTNGFFQNGDISFPLPGIWEKTTLDGIEAYYIRYRVLATNITMGTFNYCKINDLVYDWITVKEGTAYQDEILGTSTGKSNQNFTLLNTGYEEDSLSVYVKEGTSYVEWNKTTEILNEDSAALCYWIEYDAEDTVRVYFGDGVHGKIPIENSSIKATYRVCSGKSGDVGYNTINRVVSSISFLTSVTNIESFTGGADRETIQEARLNASAGLVTNQRGVNVEDYSILVKQVNGVKDAKSYENPDRWKEIWVYVLPEGNGLLTTELRSSIENYLLEKKMAGTDILLKDIEIVYINASISIKIEDNYTASDIQELVEDKYDEIMLMDNRYLAQDVLISKIYEALESIEGVEYVSISALYIEGNSESLNNIIPISELEIAHKLNTSWTYTGGSI